MKLTDGDHETTGRVDPEIGETKASRRRRLGREERRLLPRHEPTKPLIADVDIEGDAVVHPPGTAAVLVYERAHVGVGRRDLGGDPVSLTHQRGAAPFVGARLGPPDVVGAVGSRVDAALGNAERSADEGLGGDRR